MIGANGKLYRHEPGKPWQPLPVAAPLTAGARFVDLNGDGKLDLVCSNETSYGVYVFTDFKDGWTIMRSGKLGDGGAIPMITRNGANNGCFVHSGHLWWANEDTVLLKNHVDRRSFKDLLQGK